MKYYSIQIVSQMSGLSTHCIRAWEKRYGAIRPQRSGNGRRLYSEPELNRIILLGKLSALGNSISLIANLPDDDLGKLFEKLSHGQRLQKASAHQSLLRPEVYLDHLFMALHAYKLDVITHELNKASLDLSCRDFALEVVAALFKKVGEYVSAGKMSIAQEHTLSAVTKFFLGRRIFQHYRLGERSKFKVTLATPVGEHHTIGLMLACLLLVEHEVNFLYLGEDLPEESIAEAAKATNSDVVLLAISPAYRGKSKNINDVSLNLRRNLPQNTKIWIGGDVSEVNMTTVRDLGVTTFDNLIALDNKLSQIVGPE